MGSRNSMCMMSLNRFCPNTQLSTARDNRFSKHASVIVQTIHPLLINCGSDLDDDTFDRFILMWYITPCPSFVVCLFLSIYLYPSIVPCALIGLDRGAHIFDNRFDSEYIRTAFDAIWPTMLLLRFRLPSNPF